MNLAQRIKEELAIPEIDINKIQELITEARSKRLVIEVSLLGLSNEHLLYLSKNFDIDFIDKENETKGE